MHGGSCGARGTFLSGHAGGQRGALRAVWRPRSCGRVREVARRRVRGRGRGEGERRAASPSAPNYVGKARQDLRRSLVTHSCKGSPKVESSFEQTANFAAPPKAGVGPQRSAAHKQATRMVARATGRSSPLACAPRAPSRHRRKDPPDASVARRGALPCPERPRGAAQLRRVNQLRPAAAPAADPRPGESMHGPVLEFPMNPPASQPVACTQ